MIDPSRLYPLVTAKKFELNGITSQIRIPLVPGSNLGLETYYSDLAIRSYPQLLPANVGLLPPISPRPLPCTLTPQAHTLH